MKQINIRISEELHERLKKAAKATHSTVSQVVRKCAYNYSNYIDIREKQRQASSLSELLKIAKTEWIDD